MAHTRTKMLTIAEAAERLGVSERSIRRWTQDNRLPFVRLPSGRIRFDPTALDEWIDSRRRGA